MGNVNAIRGAHACVRPIAVAALAMLASGCASPAPPFSELPRLGVSTQITSRNLCGLGVSPAISIAAAPPATAQYRVRLTNLDVLFQQPWQTTAAATGAGFAEGALADYEPPCIGDMQISAFYPYQTHRLEVLALDAQSRPLAYGQTTFLVQSVSTTLDRERSAAGRQGATPVPQTPAVTGTVTDPIVGDSVGRFMNPAVIPQFPGPTIQP
jgi:hypothetical protein